MGSTTDPRGLRVLVAGGGIGGLTAAIALRQQGHEVEVFEKSRAHREVGAAVFLAPNCTAALSHLDLDPGNFGSTLYRSYKLCNAKGEIQAQGTVPEEERAKWVAPWWMTSRVELHNALKQKAASSDGPGLPVKIHTDLGVDSVDCETASLTLSDGTIVTGDLVVGADGVHSKTRRSVVGRDVPLVSSGQACYRWLMPKSLLTENPATNVIVDQPGLFVQVAGPDKHLVFYPLGSAAVTNSVMFVPREVVGEIKRGGTGHDQKANKELLLSHSASLPTPLLRMLEKVPPENIKLWDLLDMELLPSFINGKAVLIGDAAHPFLPYMGQGAAQAIEDGVALGAVFPPGTPASEIPRRLELWQRCRKDRAQKIVEITRASHHRKPAADLGDDSLAGIEVDEAMKYCIQHDTWKYVKEQTKAWVEEEAKSRVVS
ncbi:hypothetical protein VPNG_04104 [Cytospora leucostoma]|uniref:FAD-binding domain-containing protein n=1 Tax=Cytospora leucostoma TaxID=1230097 RepID=A0A423XDD9_9PEZI|nr:hypothetical protein VPNG_04104 [Cytospora leucostoma]